MIFSVYTSDRFCRSYNTYVFYLIIIIICLIYIHIYLLKRERSMFIMCVPRLGKRYKSLINLYNLCAQLSFPPSTSLPLPPPEIPSRRTQSCFDIVLIPISYIEVYTYKIYIHIRSVYLTATIAKRALCIHIRVSLFFFLIVILYLNIFIYV